jgi:Helix-turn-helix domain
LSQFPQSGRVSVVNDIDAPKKFKTQKQNLKQAILHDLGLTPIERLIGYEIADHLNERTGDAWPPQEYLATKVGCSLKTVERATRVLAGGTMDNGRWFRREIDGKVYRYIPRFNQIGATAVKGSKAVQLAHDAPLRNPSSALAPGARQQGSKAPHTRHLGRLDSRHLGHEIPDNLTDENVAQSSINNPSKIDIPESARGQVHSLPALAFRRNVGRGTAVSDTDEIDRIQTAAARANGERSFVYLNSKPFALWQQYDESHGRSPAPTRLHKVNGVWRAGIDRRSLYPPGYWTKGDH